MERIRNAAAVFLAVVLIGWIGFTVLRNDGAQRDDSLQANGSSNSNQIPPAGSQGNSQLNRVFPLLDQSTSLVDIDKILQGTPDKDNIPAISDPKFVNPSFAEVNDDTLGILVTIDDVSRYYPYDILVSHEIVNDTIGETHFAVTYCPLCGSAIVFDRSVAGEILEFGVSGFLFESNLLMYDRSDTPSLWSQARSESLIGDQAGTMLEFLPLQLLSFEELKNTHPEAEVLSRNTGFARDYDREVYAGYNDDPSTIVPISVNDERHAAKEIFYILPPSDEIATSTAIQISSIDKGETVTNSELGITINKSDDSEITATTNQGTQVFGYYEMWFSWVQHYQADGEVWAI